MLTTEFNEQEVDPVIQQHWKAASLPHFSGIVLGNGAMVVMGEQSFFVNGKVQQHVHPIGETSVTSFLDFGNEFVELTESDKRLPLGGNRYVLCGEGEMGNEGFVALVEGEALVWAGFFTISNPFRDASLEDGCIVAKTTHDTTWRFPLEAPWKVQIANEA